MEAIAPAALALSVSLDAVASLGLVIMSYQGPFVKAMLPMTDDVRLNIAAGEGRPCRSGCQVAPEYNRVGVQDMVLDEPLV
jgi:hypothetical protein